MQALLPPENHKGTWPNYAPNYIAQSVRDIDFAQLKEEGITCIAFDIDATLLPSGSFELDENTQQYIRQQKEMGNIERVAIATNRRKGNLGDLPAHIGADTAVYSQGLEFKPFATYYSRLVKQLGCKRENIAMVGDKLWQDVTGGNRAGLTTILVEPVGPPRWIERLLLSRWRRKRRLKRFK